MAFIYVIENKINRKIYVGQTHRPEMREREHFKYLDDSCPVLSAAIRKYGHENFEFTLVEKCFSQESLDEREMFWIKSLKSMRPEGYNLREGGFGGKLSKETRNKISQSLKGRKLSEEHKNKISKAMSGPNNHQYGKEGAFKGRSHSQETRQRIRDAASRINRRLPV